jgi:hypothetical protein
MLKNLEKKKKGGGGGGGVQKYNNPVKIKRFNDPIQ